MGELKIPDKGSENEVFRQGKRRLTSKTEVMFDLKTDLWRMFNCFKGAINRFNDSICVQTPKHERIRNLEAVTFNQCLVSSAFLSFPKECFFGKYRVFFMNVKGYKILFKKLAANGKPMNIRTGNIANISNQLSLDLFGDSEYIEPILYFGYKVNKLGLYEDPQIIYIDEGVIKFVINESDIDGMSFVEVENVPITPIVKGGNDVKIKAPRKREIK